MERLWHFYQNLPKLSHPLDNICVILISEEANGAALSRFSRQSQKCFATRYDINTLYSFNKAE